MQAEGACLCGRAVHPARAGAAADWPVRPVKAGAVCSAEARGAVDSAAAPRPGRCIPVRGDGAGCGRVRVRPASASREGWRGSGLASASREGWHSMLRRDEGFVAARPVDRRGLGAGVDRTLTCPGQIPPRPGRRGALLTHMPWSSTSKKAPIGGQSLRAEAAGATEESNCYRSNSRRVRPCAVACASRASAM